MGSNPYTLHLTTDGNYAWISFLSIPYLKRVNLNTFEIDKEIFLGFTRRYPNDGQRNPNIYSNNFNVFPNQNNMLVSGLKTVTSSSFESIFLYKNDSIQPIEITQGLNYSYPPTCFEPIINNQFIIGHIESNWESIFTSMKVLDDGLENFQAFDQLNTPDTRRNWIKVHHDTLIIADGTVIDARDASDLKTIGKCENQIINDRYGFAYSEFHDAYVYPNAYGSAVYLTFYDKHTYEAYDSVYILNYPHNIMMISQLEILGPDKFAIEIGKDYGLFSIKIIDTYANDIQDIGFDEKIDVYPNPVFDVLTIEGYPLSKEINIYDLSGQLLLSSNYGGFKVDINVESLKPGTYILKIRDRDSSTLIYNQKIILQ